MADDGVVKYYILLWIKASDHAMVLLPSTCSFFLVLL